MSDQHIIVIVPEETGTVVCGEDAMVIVETLQGEPGEQGEQGEQGIQGERGLDGVLGNIIAIYPVAGLASRSSIGTNSASSGIIAGVISNQSILTRSRRIKHPYGTGLGSYFYSGLALLSISDGTLLGFKKTSQFGISDTTLANNARMFIGISATPAVTFIAPSSITNCVGIGHDIEETTLKIYYGGSVAQAPIDLGINFPVSANTDLYELTLEVIGSIANSIKWTVKRLGTTHRAEGVITATTEGVELPSSNTFLVPFTYFRSNNVSGSSVAFDFVSEVIQLNI